MLKGWMPMASRSNCVLPCLIFFLLLVGTASATEYCYVDTLDAIANVSDGYCDATTGASVACRSNYPFFLYPGTTKYNVIEIYLPAGIAMNFQVCSNKTTGGVCGAAGASCNSYFYATDFFYGSLVNVGKIYGYPGAFSNNPWGLAGNDCTNNSQNSIIGNFVCGFNLTGNDLYVCRYFFNDDVQPPSNAIIGMCGNGYVMSLGGTKLEGTATGSFRLLPHVRVGAQDYYWANVSNDACNNISYLLNTTLDVKYTVADDSDFGTLTYLRKHDNLSMKALFNSSVSNNQTLLPGSEPVATGDALQDLQIYRSVDVLFNAVTPSGNLFNLSSDVYLDSNDVPISSYIYEIDKCKQNYSKCLLERDSCNLLSETFCPVLDETNMSCVGADNREWTWIDNPKLGVGFVTDGATNCSAMSRIRYQIPEDYLSFFYYNIANVELSMYIQDIQNIYGNNTNKTYGFLVCPYTGRSIFQDSSKCNFWYANATNIGNYVYLNITDFFVRNLITWDMNGTELTFGVMENLGYWPPDYVYGTYFMQNKVMTFGSMESSYPSCITIEYDNIPANVFKDKYYLNIAVVNSVTGTGIYGAEVCILGETENCGTADTYGSISFRLSNGTYVVFAGASGYYNYTRRLYHNSSLDSVTFPLKPLITESNISLSGVVFYKENDATIMLRDVEITLTQNDYTNVTRTNKYGYYRFTNFTRGTGVLMAELEGFATREVNISLRDRHVVQDIEMKRGAANLLPDECLVNVYVSESANKSPIIGAEVTFDYEKKLSDDVGLAQFLGIRNKTANLQVTASGYLTHNDLIIIPNAASYVVKVEMKTAAGINGSSDNLYANGAQQLLIPIWNWISVLTGGGIVLGVVVTFAAALIMNKGEKHVENNVQIAMLIILQIALIYLKIYPGYFGIIVLIVLAIYFGRKFIPQLSGEATQQGE